MQAPVDGPRPSRPAQATPHPARLTQGEPAVLVVAGRAVVEPWVVREVFDEAQRRVCTCRKVDNGMGTELEQDPMCPSHPDVITCIAALRSFLRSANEAMSAPGVPGTAETSRDAARAKPPTELRFKDARFEVLRALSMVDMTAAQVTDVVAKRTGRAVSRNQIATRLNECRAAGWVEYVTVDGNKVRRPTSFGPDSKPVAYGYVQRLTSLGRKVLRDALLEKIEAGLER